MAACESILIRDGDLIIRDGNLVLCEFGITITDVGIATEYDTAIRLGRFKRVKGKVLVTRQIIGTVRK